MVRDSRGTGRQGRRPTGLGQTTRPWPRLRSGSESGPTSTARERRKKKRGGNGRGRVTFCTSPNTPRSFIFPRPLYVGYLPNMVLVVIFVF